MEKLSRRTFLKKTFNTALWFLYPYTLSCRNGESSFKDQKKDVAVLSCSRYEHQALRDALTRGWNHTKTPDLRGKRVVIKPNFVEFHPERAITVNPHLIGVLIELLKSKGAGSIVVAEAPAVRRNAQDLWREAGLKDICTHHNVPIVDLNYDNLLLGSIKTFKNSLLSRIYLPATIVKADVMLSVAKMKCHHWAGVTLCLKNMFGIIPGIKYGWPKNILHWNGITQSIIEINNTILPHYCIIDGIEAMEGDGPLAGDTVHAGVLIMGDNPVMVDSAGAQIMGINPERVDYLAAASQYLRGGTPLHKFTLFGESVASVQRPFRLIKQFTHLRG